MFTTILAYLLIAVFLVMERRMRRGRQAASLDAGQDDQASTRGVGQAFGVTFFLLLLAPLANYLHIGALPALPWGVLGLVIMACGLGLRYWASRTLGSFYTRTLLVTAEQRIVDQGPYHLIRHPGYLADIGLLAGAGLAVMNWIALVIILIALLRAYLYRIRAEEAMLQKNFGAAYTAYQARTWKLIPKIY